MDQLLKADGSQIILALSQLAHAPKELLDGQMELAPQVSPGALVLQLNERTQGCVLPPRRAGRMLRSEVAQSQEISLTQKAKPANGS